MKAYQYVQLVEQHYWNYCGPASVLQNLYGMNTENNVPGNTDLDKMYYLASSNYCNVIPNQSGSDAHVWRMVNTLNAFTSSSFISYTYKSGSLMTLQEFTNGVVASLFYGKPVILHAMTEHISYYGGYSTGYYITIDAIDLHNGTVRLVDPNYNNQYRGYHVVTIEEAYNSIQMTSSGILRYVIW